MYSSTVHYGDDSNVDKEFNVVANTTVVVYSCQGVAFTRRNFHTALAGDVMVPTYQRQRKHCQDLPDCMQEHQDVAVRGLVHLSDDAVARAIDSLTFPGSPLPAYARPVLFHSLFPNSRLHPVANAPNTQGTKKL